MKDDCGLKKGKMEGGGFLKTKYSMLNETLFSFLFRLKFHWG
jgi:hypothetical protein